MSSSNPQQMPEGDIWKSYFASRLAWADEALTVRRGEQLDGARNGARTDRIARVGRNRRRASARVTCFALGLPFHRRAAPNWLDTLLLVAGEERRRFQFAIGLDQPFPTHAALGTADGRPTVHRADAERAELHRAAGFCTSAAKNVLVTHIEPLAAPASGVRLRLLETEGRETRTNLAAFRPFHAARTTDFRGNAIEVLSVVDGRVEFDIGPHRWVQIEAEW